MGHRASMRWRCIETFLQTQNFERLTEQAGVHERFEGAEFARWGGLVRKMQTAQSDHKTLLVGEALKANTRVFGVFDEAGEIDVGGEIDFAGTGERIRFTLVGGVGAEGAGLPFEELLPLVAIVDREHETALDFCP